MKETSVTLRCYVTMIAAFAFWNLWRAPQPATTWSLVAAVFFAYAALDFRRLLARAPYVLKAVFIVAIFPVVRAFLADLQQGSVVIGVLVAIPIAVATYLLWQINLAWRALKASS